MKVTFIAIVIGALSTVTEGSWKGLNGLEITGRVEIVITISILRSAIILRNVMEILVDLLSLKLL